MIQSLQLITPFFREESMPRIDELCNKFCVALELWITIREDTIQKIHNTIENLRFHHRNVNVIQIAGSSMSILGSAMALASIVMVPATAGLSLVLPVGGVALALAGGGTSAGASVVDVVIQQSNVQQAQEQLIHDYEQLYIISALAIAIQSKIDDEHVRQQCQGVSTAKILVVLGLALTQGVFRISNLGVKIAEVFALAFAAVKTGGTTPARFAATAVLEGLGQTLGSAIGGTLFSSLGKAIGGDIGGAFGKGLMDFIAPKASGIAGARAGSATVKGLAKAGVVLNVLTIPIDLFEIIRSGTNLAKGSETEAIEQLTNIVEQLESEKEAIQVALVQNRQTQATREDETQATREDETQASREDETQATREDETQATGESETQGTGKDEMQATREDEKQDTREDETQATREDETQATREDETQGTRQNEKQGTREDELQASREDEKQGTREDETQATKEDAQE